MILRYESDSKHSYRAAVLRFARRLLWAVAFYNVILLGSATGYHYLEGWDWFDSLYMAVITASSVGYSETHPLSEAGRSFTMFVIGASILGLGFLTAMFTSLLVELDLGDTLRRRRMLKRIDDLQDHYIVCGAGRMGRVVVGELLRAGTQCVVLDNRRSSLEALSEQHPDVPCVEGDATHDHLLDAAGVRSARGLAATLSEDADNLFLCLTARALNPRLEIASRVNYADSVSKMLVAGVNHTILPNVSAGVRLATTLLRPAVVDFLDASTTVGQDVLQVEAVDLAEASGLVGQSLAAADLPKRSGVIVLAHRKQGEAGTGTFNPDVDTVLQSGDRLIVVGRQEHLGSVRRLAAS